MSDASSTFVPQVPKPISPPYSPRTIPSDPDTIPYASESDLSTGLDTPVLTPLSASTPSADSRSRYSSVNPVLALGAADTRSEAMSNVAGERTETLHLVSSGIDNTDNEDLGVPSTISSARPSFEINNQTGLGNRRGHVPAGFDGFASSSSIHPSGSGTEQRDRLVTPTRSTFVRSNSTPRVNESPSGSVRQRGGGEHDGQTWSTAMDGEKGPLHRHSPKPPSTTTGFAPYDQPIQIHPMANYRARSPYLHSPVVGTSELHQDTFPHPLTNHVEYNQTTSRHSEREQFTDSTAYWLGLYFFFNLGLTLFNKVVLVSFPFPYTLTGLHALSGCAGTYIALERGAFIPARLTQTESLILAAFSVLYTINIAVSNISLQLVTVPFHQVVRASTPLFTIVISTVVLRTRFSMMKLVSLLPVVAGVGFATYGDYYFTAWGLILTLLGTFLAALKTVVTNLIQTGGGQRLKLHPLDLLMRMSPLAFVQCVIYGWWTGELDRVRQYGATQMTKTKAIALLINGIIACGLNIVSFTANKKAGALTMTVSANCKQVLTIALAVVLFDLSISATNGIGILLTLIGGGWYGYVEYSEKKKKTTTKIVDKS